MNKDLVRSIIETFVNFYKDALGPSADWFYITNDWEALTGGVVAPIFDYIRIVGVGLTLIYFLMELNQKLALEGHDLTMKTFAAPFIKLFMATVAIQYSGQIVGWILKFNDVFVASMVSETTPVSTDMIDAMVNAADGGFFVLIFLVLFLVISMILTIVLKLVWGYKAIMYKLEVLFRLALLPIATADVYNGMNSNAIRYVKGFLVLGITAVSMVTLPKLAFSIAVASGFEATGELANGWGILAMIGNLLVAPFAAIAATGVAKQLAKEAVGA